MNNPPVRLKKMKAVRAYAIQDENGNFVDIHFSKYFVDQTAVIGDKIIRGHFIPITPRRKR